MKRLEVEMHEKEKTYLNTIEHLRQELSNTNKQYSLLLQQQLAPELGEIFEQVEERIALLKQKYHTI